MNGKTIKFFSEPKVKPAELHRAYYAYTYSDSARQYLRGEDIRLIYFNHGELFIDDLHIVRPRFEPRSVSWHQQTKGRFSSGYLSFDLDGIKCQGSIALGTSAESHARYDLFATAIPPSTYTTQLTSSRFPEGTDINNIAASAWVSGLAFQLGYQDQPGQPLPIPDVTMDNQQITDYVSLIVLENDQLQIQLALDADVVCQVDNNLYLSGSIVFSTFGETFSGEVIATCQDETGLGSYFWRGTVTGQQPFAAPASFTRISEDELVSDTALTLGELITLVPDETVTQLANTMLVENMKWAVGQNETEKDWLRTFFGQQPPTLSPAQQAIAGQGADWYQQKFAVAYLTSAFDNWDGAGASAIKLDDNQKAKLKHYLKEGLAKEDGFNTQMNLLDRLAYVESKNRVQDYINDGGEKWAAALFAAITSASQLSLLLNRVKANHDMSAANNFAVLLQTLDPSGNYAKQYAQVIVSRVLLDATLQTKIVDKDLTMSWMPSALETFVREYGTPETDVAPDAALVSDEKRAVADALKEAAQALDGFTALASQFADFLIAAKGTSIVEQSELAREAFATAHPNLAAAGDALFFISWVGGVFNVVVSFLNWNAESPTEKANVITSCVDLIGSAADRVVSILKGEMTLDSWNQLNQWASDNVELEDFAQINREVAGVEDEGWIQVGLEDIPELFNAEMGTIVVAETRWARIYANAAKVVSVIGIATSAAFTVLSTIDFINDIKSGQPVSKIAFDGILMASNAITAVCLVLDLVLSVTVFALAAAVFAIIGLIASIVLLFLPKAEDTSPTTQFMENTGVPFVNALPAPPEPSGAPLSLSVHYNPA